jgi:hypothetical protein
MEIPGNLGTLIRTLDAAGAGCLVLTNRRTRLTHPKVSIQGLDCDVTPLPLWVAKVCRMPPEAGKPPLPANGCALGASDRCRAVSRG